MPVPISQTAEAWLGATLCIFFILALFVYGEQVRRILRDGCKVHAEAFDLPELLMTMVFAGFFGFIVLSSLQHREHEPEVNIGKVLPNSLIFIIFTVGIAGFLRFRGLSLKQLFGFTRQPVFTGLAWSFGLLLAALPLASAANAVTMLVVHEKLEPQPLVDLFSKVTRNHDLSGMSIILASAVLIQPVCEEFLFRGFFYAVWKRYLGPLGAGFLTCLLFAAFHTSVAAFAGLFVLAVCLNIAYERTGSLLVPIGMHALFNLTSLLILIYQQTQPVAAP